MIYCLNKQCWAPARWSTRLVWRLYHFTLPLHFSVVTTFSSNMQVHNYIFCFMFFSSQKTVKRFWSRVNFNTYRQLFSSLHHWLVFSLVCCFLLSLLEICHFSTVSTTMATCESFAAKVLVPLLAWKVNLCLAWTNTISNNKEPHSEKRFSYKHICNP